MRIIIVVDSNRVVAALIRDSTTRKILWREEFEFVAPEFCIEEVRKYQDEIMVKAAVTPEEFELLLSLLLECITLIPKEEYHQHLKELEQEISDPNDMPYLACSLAVGATGIWTHDPHFLQQDKVKIFTNIDLLKLSRRETLI